MPSKARPRNTEDAIFSSVDLEGLQPDCEGPKLGPFVHRRAPMQFIQRLSNPEHDGQAHVFEINIARKVYALKIFKFYEDESDVEAFTRSEVEDVGLDVIHAHSDPFYNECRAYGRLLEFDLNGSIAVAAHGYMTIPAKKVHELGRRFQIDDWTKDAEEHSHQDLPPYRHVFRAIVKDFIPNDLPFTHKRVKQMLQHLMKMRERGIYPMDIKRSNYKGGLLVDLSAAMTRPHFFLDMCAESRYERLMNEDLCAFDDMIDEAKVKTWVRAYTEDYKKRLRPRNPARKLYPK
ncbi:MAG: hypothetical protein Q9209_003826 [Squamulea sp. 1 TL-2023]